MIYLEKIIGVLMIFIGVFGTIYLYKKPIKFLKALNFRGHIGCIGLIILGVLVLIGEFHILRKFY